MIVDKINEYLSRKDLTLDEAMLTEISELSAWSFKRQFMESRTTERKVRFSNAGKCPRALAYMIHDYPHNGKEMDSRSLLAFWYGDMAEMIVTNLAKHAGVPLKHTGKDQLELELALPSGQVIKGHPDGVVGDYLFECKSMTSFSFEDFERGKIDRGYLVQVNLNMLALHLEKCVIVAFNKNSNVLAEQIVSLDETLLCRTRCDLHHVFTSTKEDLPERMFKPNERGFLPWQCAYCFAHGHCYPKAKKVLVGKSYKLKLEKTSEK